MGELQYTLEKIWKQLKIIGVCTGVITILYFVIQSVYLYDLFYNLYIEPVIEFFTNPPVLF